MKVKSMIDDQEFLVYKQFYERINSAVKYVNSVRFLDTKEEDEADVFLLTCVYASLFKTSILLNSLKEENNHE